MVEASPDALMVGEALYQRRGIPAPNARFLLHVLDRSNEGVVATHALKGGELVHQIKCQASGRDLYLGPCLVGAEAIFDGS